MSDEAQNREAAATNAEEAPASTEPSPSDADAAADAGEVAPERPKKKRKKRRAETTRRAEVDAAGMQRAVFVLDFPDDPELLADMVLAAANEALRAATQAVETKLRGQMPDLGALGLPGM